jgi:phospholipase C
MASAAFAGEPATGITKIQHIVFIIKENRTFDNYFGTYPGADGATSGMISTGAVIPLVRAEDQYPVDPGHAQSDWFLDYDSGAMDGWNLQSQGDLNGFYPSMTQHYEEDIPNYWAYARYFTLGDRMFSSFNGPSFPAHLFTIAAQPSETIQIPSEINGGHGGDWGCDADPLTVVRSRTSNNIRFYQFPCFKITTMADLLDQAGISWKSYAPTAGEVAYWFNTYNSIEQIRNSSLWTSNVVSDQNFITDALAGNLPAVSWLTTGENLEEDHPPHSVCLGENWTVRQLNAIMQGPDWGSTAVFIVWDDWGGLYDHVPPPQVDANGFGGRVPFLLISPYAKSGAVTHTVYEFSSVLKFVEKRFGLPSLSTRDAAANDLTDAFDFNQTPLNPLILQERPDCPLIASNTYFGNVPVGQASPANQLNLLNNRPSTLNIRSVAATGDYSVKSECGSSVPPMGQCLIDITFKPKATGPRTGTVRITDSDPSSPQTINLMGVGTDLAISTRFLKFPAPIPLGASSTLPLNLKNTGTKPITIQSIATGKYYSHTNNCAGTLAPGASCTVKITYTSTTDGIHPGTFIVTDSAEGSPHSAFLFAISTAIGTSPASLSFGAVPVGTQGGPLAVTIHSYGSTPLSIGTILARDGYEQKNDCPQQLPLHESCQVQVTFTPTAKGPVTGFLVIPSSDIQGPNTITLTGSGI